MPIVELKDGYVDLDSLKVCRDGQFSSITRTEGRLLQYLLARKGELVSREELLATVWGYRKGVRSRTLDTYIWRLRRKLEPDPAQPSLLLTEARQGVRLMPPPPPPPEGSGQQVVAVLSAPMFTQRVLEDASLMSQWRTFRFWVLEHSRDGGMTPSGVDTVGSITLEGVAAEPALNALMSLIAQPSEIGALHAGVELVRWPDQGRRVALVVGRRRASRLAALAFPGQIMTSLRFSRALPPRRTMALGQLPLELGAPPEPLFAPRIIEDVSTLPEPEGVVFGRAEERATIQAAVGVSRLVTLVGPDGVGKSTLARSWAASDSDAGQMDIIYCELGPEAGAAALAPALGRVLDVSDDKLAAALHARGSVVVLLDRVGSALPAGAAQLEAWMAAAPESRWLVTAHAPLSLPGEQVVPVAPLVPREAAAMFLDRVAGLPGYAQLAPTDDTVAEVVTAIGGMPLAIELASTRARLFSPQQLLGRLQENPAQPRPSEVRRLGAMDGAVAFSWSLLSDVAREGLSRLATFTGDFSMYAAEVALSGLQLQPAALVEELADASLLRLRHEPRVDDVRLLLLEPVRAFALLRISPEDRRQVRHQVARWLAQSSARWNQQASGGPRQYIMLRRLRGEQHNLLAAFDAIHAEEPVTALQLLVSCNHLVGTLQTISPAHLVARLKQLPALPSPHRAEATWLLVSLRSRLDAPASVLGELERLLQEPDLTVERRDQARVLLALCHFLTGQLAESQEVLDVLRPLFEVSPLPLHRLELIISICVLYSQLPSGLNRSIALARHALASAEAMAAPLYVDRLTLYLAKCEALRGQLEPAFLPGLLTRCRRMRAEGARAIAQPYLVNLARAQLALSGPGAALPLIHEVRRHASRAGDEFELGNIDRLLVEAHLTAGRLDEARTIALRLVAEARAASANTFLRLALLRLALIELLASHPTDGLRALLSLREQPLTAFDAFHCDCIEACLWVVAGDRARAQTCLQQAQPPTPAIQALCEIVAAWVEPALAAGTRSRLLAQPLTRGTGTSGFVLRALLVGLPE